MPCGVCLQTESALEQGNASTVRPDGGMEDTVMGEGVDPAPSSSAAAVGGGLGGSATAGEEEALDETYLQLFLLKYVCPRDACFGTMAPVFGTDVLECCVCGSKRTESQFLAELESQ